MRCLQRGRGIVCEFGGFVDVGCGVVAWEAREGGWLGHVVRICVTANLENRVQFVVAASAECVAQDPGLRLGKLEDVICLDGDQHRKLKRDAVERVPILGTTLKGRGNNSLPISNLHG